MLERLRLHRHYHATFATFSGRIVLGDLLDKCYALGTTYVPGDTHETAFREGQRQVALQLLQILKIDAHEAEALMRDAREEAHHVRRRTEQYDADPAGGVPFVPYE